MKPGKSCVPFLLCLAACSAGPPLRTYVLTPPLQTTPTPMPALPVGRIVIARVRVPDYLDTNDIVLRDGNNQVKASATGRWAERLSHGLTRALADDLGAHVESDEVLLDASNAAPRRVLVDVSALDLWPDGNCTLAATWAIVDHATPRAVAYGGGSFNSSPAVSTVGVGSTVGGGDGRLIDAMSRTVSKLAAAIALNVRESADRSALRVD
jgi:uncharacterized lipoprotein YmbA